jgi:hypothetical protein
LYRPGQPNHSYHLARQHAHPSLSPSHFVTGSLLVLDTQRCIPSVFWIVDSPQLESQQVITTCERRLLRQPTLRIGRSAEGADASPPEQLHQRIHFAQCHRRAVGSRTRSCLQFEQAAGVGFRRSRTGSLLHNTGRKGNQTVLNNIETQVIKLWSTRRRTIDSVRFICLIDKTRSEFRVDTNTLAEPNLTPVLVRTG